MMSNNNTKVRLNGVHHNPSTEQAPSRAQLITQEAQKWASFVMQRSGMNSEKVAAKALDAVAFSIDAGAKALAIPSKLVGVKEHQTALISVAELHPIYAHRLEVSEVEGQIVVRFGDAALGRIQDKHLAWVRPLMIHGISLYLLAITGTDSEAKLKGVNIAIGHVAGAIARLREVEASRQKSCDLAMPDEDIVLWRDVNGYACANIMHVVRHSPTGIEWGFNGAGPADLARSILLRFVGLEEADRLYQLFKQDVVAQVSKAGGRIEATVIRRWLDDHQADA